MPEPNEPNANPESGTDAKALEAELEAAKQKLAKYDTLFEDAKEQGMEPEDYMENLVYGYNQKKSEAAELQQQIQALENKPKDPDPAQNKQDDAELIALRREMAEIKGEIGQSKQAQARQWLDDQYRTYDTNKGEFDFGRSKADLDKLLASGGGQAAENLWKSDPKKYPTVYHAAAFLKDTDKWTERLKENATQTDKALETSKGSTQVDPGKAAPPNPKDPERTPQDDQRDFIAPVTPYIEPA